MKRFGLFPLLALTLGAAACGGNDKPARVPGTNPNLVPALSSAFREEAIGDPVKAVDLYVKALAIAAASPEDPASAHVAMASLEALVHRDVAAFADVSSTSALADRIDPALLAKSGSIDARLAKVEEDAAGPFVRPLVANARLALAERRGDEKAATNLRRATGCATEALLAGPVAWMPTIGAREPALLAKGGATPSELPGPGPFNAKIVPAKVASFGCHIPLYAQTTAAGVREVAIDVTVPKDGVIGVGLRSSTPATLWVGGKLAIDRGHALGNRTVTKLARVESSAGELRIVARVGMDSDYANVELAAWDEDGKPLAARAAGAGKGSAATVAKTAAAEPPENAAKTDPERLAIALGALAANDPRTAENILHPHVAQTNVAPELLLTYARAVRLARDLPNVKSQERARAAYDRVLEAWPNAWEAVLEHAVLAGARRGQAEARIETLTDLDKTRAKGKAALPPIVDAFEAQIAGREQLHDRAKAAYDRAAGPLKNTPLLFDVDRAAFERTGRDVVAFECDPKAARNASGLGCHRAHTAVGDRVAAEKELVRLRALAGTPQLYLSLSSRDALESGDLGRAGKLLDAMNPADRPLSTIYAVKGKASVPEILRMSPTSREAPGVLPSLLRDSGDDPLARFDGISEKAVNDPAATSALANAATAILVHDERYDVDANGLVHFLLLDVRRVMGTTDVESNAQASAPTVYGRDAVRVLRRRIFKKDGRIILPDPTPRASQAHADLSQLEAGDAVEAIYEGWSVPGETGNIGIDTPDLLPERTAIHDATIELRVPQGIKSALWSHALLGKPTEKAEAGKRVLTWKLKDRGVRRLESGVPKMDRNVAVSFSTTQWNDVSRGLKETIAALDADGPELTDWAREAAGPVPPSRALVEKVVAASGQAVKEASGVILADVDLGRAGAATTARTILATHEGSRTWLIVKALRERGVATDIVVAENEPFSDSADFPPHFGRFMHPLAVAHVPCTADGASATDPNAKPGGANAKAAAPTASAPKAGCVEDVWIDADVPGPPLPAGRISPELRGRNALWADGRIAALPAVASNAERDEIDIRLAVDDQGNAKGTITVLLRGRSAQDLSEALVHLVGLERQRALRGIALGWVPFATIEKVDLSSTEGSWQVAMRAELSAPAYAQVEGSKPGSRTWVLPGMDPIHYVFPRPFVTTLSSTYASHGARESALAINRATQYHVRRRVDLPAKAQIARLPGPFDGKGPLLGATRKINVTGNSIEEDFLLEVTTGTVPRDKYDAFVMEAHRTDDAFQASTRVKPPVP